MSELDQIIGQVPMDQVAEALGVDRAQAESAVRTALPALLGGLHANAADPAGAASLGQALADHDGSALGADLGSLDLDDGQKIVGNIFGNQTSDVIAQLGGVRGGGGSSLIAKLLPILAPIVLAYLGKKLTQQGGLGGVLGDVVGGRSSGGASGSASSDSSSGQMETPSGPLIPTGGSAASQDQGGPSDAGASADQGAGGGGLGDILGQILGAGGGQGGSGSGGAASGGDILGGILGGLLGGGRR